MITRGNFINRNGGIEFVPAADGRWMVLVMPKAGEYHCGMDLNY